MFSAREKKYKKADGGCLGDKGRRRTWYTAKSTGEPCAGRDPVVSEWGNPTRDERATPKGEGTRGSETSEYPEEKKQFRE